MSLQHFHQDQDEAHRPSSGAKLANSVSNWGMLNPLCAAFLAPVPVVGLLMSLLFALSGCTSERPISPEDTSIRALPADDDVKADIFGRKLAGVAAPYEADLTIEERREDLRTQMQLRRQVAWEVVARTLDPVPLLGLAESAAEHEEIQLPDGEVPNVPRFQTWYGVDDFKRMFQELYSNLEPADRAVHTAFSEEQLDEVFPWNATALDRSRRWPLERYFNYIDLLGLCPEDIPQDECARRLQSDFSGATGGNARITYSPATIRHLLENYGAIVDCLGELDTLPIDATPDTLENFSFCFESEFPPDAVLVKAQWVRSGQGVDFQAYDTDAETLTALTQPGASGDWGEGNRAADPSADEILTVRHRNSQLFRLAGMHIMSKEARHWLWISLWWSDTPDSDFGEDRPDFIGELDPVFQNYKMCVATEYLEGDDNVSEFFQDTPSLAAALDAMPEDATWCSNPYIEHGRGNARTNCIGCHQHGGATVFEDLDGDGMLDRFDLEAVITNESQFPNNGRSQMRNMFPADYLYSFSRVDDLAGVIRSETNFYALRDRDRPEVRTALILAIEDVDTEAGGQLFADNCADCHGADGNGGFGPSLFDRFSARQESDLLQTIITGRGDMPTWGVAMSHQDLANLFSYLKAEFTFGP